MTPPKINAQIQQIANTISKGMTDHNVEQRCIKLLKKHPKNTDLILQYGLLLYLQKKYLKAETVLENGIALNPRHSDLQIILFACFKDSRNYEKMLKLCHTFKTSSNINEQALAYTAYLEICDWDQAAKLEKNIIKAAIEGKIQRKYLSAILLLSNGLPHISIKEQYKLHSNWGAAFSPRKLLNKSTKPLNRIRIAYVSADFYRHPVGFFMLQIIASHHRDKFEVFCYAQLMTEHDEVTELFKSNADHFIDITQLDDQMLAQKMQYDAIHIAVDLSGHTFDSRTQAFGKRMAPVQISYLGYPNTSGLEAMDFHISDHYAEHLEQGTKYTEKLLLMPKSFLLYGMEWTETKNTTAPCEDTGIISFGSFNHSRKLNLDVIQVWSSILTSVSNSRLYLKFFGSESPLVQTNIYNAFKKQGIDKERITILDSSPTPSEHILMYHHIDIALDTFPYTGTTTTCEALSQGVPVVTLVGSKHSNRVSYAILKNIGFEDSIAYSKKEYIEKAINLAQNPQGLSILRKCLPTLLQHSPLRNSEEFINDLECLYKKAWEIKMDQPAFMERQVELTALTMNNNITIMLPQDLNEITTYVLTEQGDWYEDELRFLRLIAKPSMRILDCSAEYGCYSLSLAKEVGSDGAVFALEKDTNKRHAIEESAKLNSFDWITTGNEADTAAFLQDGVDIMIHPTAEIDASASYLNMPANISPLIMIHAMQENGLDESLSSRMQQQGYKPYRLIPSLNLLIPIKVGFTPTSWHRQVFFCKEDKAAELASSDFLMLHELESIDLPDDLSYWQQAIEGRAFANALLPLWIEQVQEGQVSDEWEHVRNALAAYAMANNKDSSAQQRYAYLSAALNILLNTEQLQSSVARLCTVARIASELGNYTIAIQAAQMAHEGITTLQAFVPDEPFLPMDSTYDQDDYQNNLAEWMLAQALVLIEKLQHPTLFLTSYSDLSQINTKLCNLGFPDKQLSHRKKLTFKKSQQGPLSPTLKNNPPKTKKKPTLRLIHNLARSGSTLICKCVGVMNNIRLLSEIHPNSIDIFNPILQAQEWFHLFNEQEIDHICKQEKVSFPETIALIRDKLEKNQDNLVIRDWAHLDFTGTPFTTTPSYQLGLANELQNHFELIQLSIIRHPIDQWLSLSKLEIMREAIENGSLTIQKFIFGYYRFARKALETGFIRYEDFTQAPENIIKQACHKLQLPYDETFIEHWHNYQTITGDIISTRGGNTIKPLQRRVCEPDLLERFESCPAYHASLKLLGYEETATSLQQQKTWSTGQEKPLVSIILLAYNHKKFIQKAIEGILQQTYSPLEIIISDDASTDNSYEIIKNTTHNYKGHHTIKLNKNENNLGIVNHINHCFSLCNGSLILLAAGDDISLPERIKVTVETWNYGVKGKAFRTNPELIDHKGISLHRKLLLPNENLQQHMSYSEIISHQFAPAWNGAFDREVFDVFGPLPLTTRNEDQILPFRGALLGGYTLIPNDLIKYRQHQNNFSISRKREKANSSIEKNMVEQEHIKNYLDNSQNWIKALDAAHKMGLVNDDDLHVCKQSIYEIIRSLENHLIAITSIEEMCFLGLSDINNHICTKISEKTFVNVNFPRVYGLCDGGTLKLQHDAINIYKLPNARIEPLSDIVKIQRGAIWTKGTQVTIHMELPDDLNLIKYNTNTNIISLKARSSNINIKKAYSLFGRKACSWSHFIVELLPKLIMLRNLPPPDKHNLTILVPKAVDKHIQRLVQDCLRNQDDLKILLVDTETEVICESLYWCSSPAYLTNHANYIHPSQIVIPEITRKIIAESFSIYKAKPLKQQKIYIGRKGVRNIDNQEEIENIFMKGGYQIHFPHQMTFDEKIDLFGNATHIAGPASSGFVNALFSKNKIKYVCFFNYERCLDAYSQVFGAFPNIEQWTLTGETLGSSGINANYSLNITHLKEFLKNTSFDNELLQIL